MINDLSKNSGIDIKTITDMFKQNPNPEVPAKQEQKPISPPTTPTTPTTTKPTTESFLFEDTPPRRL